MANGFSRESEVWKTVARMISRPPRGFLRDVLGNGARFTHSVAAFKYVHLGPRISPMTRALRKRAGITSMRSGDATGRLAKAVGTPEKGLSGVEHSLGIDRPAIRWHIHGFVIGENYPSYVKYLESGWTQVFTGKQAAFLTYKIHGAWNFMTWKNLAGTLHFAPPRKFNFLNTMEVGRLQGVVQKSLRMAVDHIGRSLNNGLER